jgi:hypothetical protein
VYILVGIDSNTGLAWNSRVMGRDVDCDIDKQKLLNRIFAGKFYCKTHIEHPSLIFVLFKHPILKQKMRADYIYEMAYDIAIERGAIAEKEAISTAIDKHIWSKIEECNITNLQQYIDKLENNQELPNIKYNTIAIDDLKKKIHDATLKLNGLKSKRQQITISTVEKYAEICKYEYIVRSVTYLINGHKLFSHKNLDILSHFNLSELISALSDLYFKEAIVKESHIRLLARSNPWRLYYGPAKHLHMRLFNRNPEDFTDEQIRLLHWSSIYDYAYESTERPGEHIINNDSLFDKWLEEQDKKSKSAASNSQYNVPASKRTGPGITEVFITTTPDKAAEIDELNSPVVRAAKRKMFEKLAQKGEVTVREQHSMFAGVT